MTGSLLRLQDIEKSFFGVQVLKGVSLTLDAGQTLGLVGENGAGKSTLMNILGGNLRADAGSIYIQGQPYRPTSSRDAENAGIAFIHQELNLFSNLSIAENLFLNRFPCKFGCIDRRALMSRATDLLNQVGLELSPRHRIESLSSGERQLVEIAKALCLDARIIILDEPTTSLTSRETEKLFALLNQLKSRGIAMIYISHALRDVRRLCDSVAVLRDGSLVGSGPTDEFPESRMVTMMVGRELDKQFPDRSSTPRSEKRLEAKKLSLPGTIHDISFDLHAGEVLGIAGLMGSGRTELARILFGLELASSGTLILEGKDITSLAVRQRIALGMAMLTESRREDGLCMQASIDENIGLVAATRFANKFFGSIESASLTNSIRTIRDSVQITQTAKGGQSVQTLSGGNQQKVVLAKWLLNTPRVLILDEPTRGIDVGAKFEIYRLIAKLVESGTAILVISSEIEELIGICDRILVMSRGEMKDELANTEFDRERIMRSALQSDLSFHGLKADTSPAGNAS
ncbi:MAG: sugar ABC transporter ATP-binding protein [Pirellula sp.]